jgi:ureidoacrylate peracid hydrolase
MSQNSRVVSEGGLIAVHPRAAKGRPPGMGAPLMLDPATAAVVVVDMQKYFLETPPFMGMREIVPPLARFLPAARDAGLVVVHVITEFGPGMEGAGRPGSRTRQMMDSTGMGLVRGADSATIPPELGHDPSDVVVTKTRFSGFWGSNLADVLRGRGIETLIFAGGTTTVCVESTVRDAVFLEFNALVLSDCTRDISPELHESALARIDLFFGWVCDSTDLAAALQTLHVTRGAASQA